MILLFISEKLNSYKYESEISTICNVCKTISYHRINDKNIIRAGIFVIRIYVLCPSCRAQNIKNYTVLKEIADRKSVV